MASVSPEAQACLPSFSRHEAKPQDSDIMANAMKPLPESQETTSHDNSRDETLESLGLTRENGFSYPNMPLEPEEKINEGFQFAAAAPYRMGQFTGQRMQPIPATQLPGHHSTQIKQGRVGQNNHIPPELRQQVFLTSSIDPTKSCKTALNQPQVMDDSPSMDNDKSKFESSHSLTADLPAFKKTFEDSEPIRRPPAPTPFKERPSTRTPSRKNPVLLSQLRMSVSGPMRDQRSMTKDNMPGDNRSHLPSSSHKKRVPSEPQEDSDRRSPSIRSNGNSHQRHQTQDSGLTRPLRDKDMQQHISTPQRGHQPTLYPSNTARKATPAQGSRPVYRETSAVRKTKASISNRRRNEKKAEQGVHMHYADIMNNFVINERKRKQEVIAMEDQFVEALDGQELRIKQHVADLEERNKQIEQLTDRCDAIQSQLDAKSSELGNQSSELEKLKGKLEEYKGFLNGAIQEQQDLYRTSREGLKNAEDKLRAEQLKANTLEQQGKAKIEATQESLRQRISTSLSEIKRLQLEFGEKLHEKDELLEARNADLARERTTIKALNQRIADERAHRDQLTKIQDQTSAISRNISDLETRHEQQRATSDEGQAVLATILERLDDLTKDVKSQRKRDSEWVTENEQTTSTIIAQLKQVASAQNKSADNTSQLTQQVNCHMKDVWRCVNESKAALNLQLGEKTLENMILSTTVEEKEEHLRDLSTKLDLAIETEFENELRIHELKTQIWELESSPKDDPAIIQQIQALKEEKEQLREELASGVSAVSLLQASLQQKEQESATAIKKHEEEAHGFTQRLEEQETAARKNQEEAVNAAIREEAANVEKVKQDLQQLVDQAENNRDDLIKQLDAAKTTATELRQKGERDAEIIQSLRSDLEGAESRASSLTEDKKKRLAENEEANKRNESTVLQLEKDLAEAEQSLAQITEDSEAYERETQSLIDDLKRWAKNEHGVGKPESQMQGNDDQAMSEVNPVRIAKLRELQALHNTIIPHYGNRKSDSKLAQSSVKPQTRAQRLAGQAEVTPVVQVPAEQMAHEEDMTVSALLQAGLIDPKVLDRNRRVILQSPAGDLILPSPPSIAEEKERRRKGRRPRGIMRASDGISTVEPELEERRLLFQLSEIPGSGIFGRGVHSQNVAGNTPYSGISARTRSRKKPYLASSDRTSEGDGSAQATIEDVVQIQPASRKRSKPVPDSAGQRKKAKTQPVSDEVVADPNLLRQSGLEVDSEIAMHKSRSLSVADNSASSQTSATTPGTPRSGNKIKLSENQQTIGEDSRQARAPSQSRKPILRTYSTKYSDESPRVPSVYPIMGYTHHRRSTSIVADSQELAMP